MGLISLLFTNPLAFVLVAVPLLYSIILHEVAHGWVANRMGDPTAKWAGRLTLNPLSHLDPIGTAMLLVFGFGWAKPVPVNFNRLSDLRKGLIFVSAAGITANILLAFLGYFFLGLLGQYDLYGLPQTMLYHFARVNVMLASFNIIPIPPLDGSKILMGFASRNFQYTLSRIEPYGIFIIMALLFFRILDPVIRFFQEIILFFIGLLLP